MVKTTAKRRSKPSTNGRAKKSSSKVIDDSTWLIISYRRFSSDRQKHGRSEDRQEASFNQFLEAEKRQHPDRTYLTDSLPMDRGMSAFYGEHRKRGHLGKFIKRIESGEIKVIPGRTIIFIEEVKRLSREGSKKALEHTVFKLFDAGITVRFENGLEFNTELIEKIPGWLGVLSTLLDLAFDDSRQKKEWLDDVWDAKHKRAVETGEAIVSAPPYWIRIVGREWDGDRVIVPGKYVLIPEAAKAVVKMFKWAADGLGYTLIQQKLNHDANTKGGWVPPKRANQSNQQWRRTYVQLTLKNRAVIGEYQPHRKVGGKYGKRVTLGDPNPTFYPNALKNHPGLFELVQQKIAAKRGISQAGAKGQFPNVMTGMVRCGYCGGAMHFGPRGRRIHYLYCYDSGGRQPPGCPSMKYEDCEAPLLDQLQRLKPERVLPKKDVQEQQCDKLRIEEQRIAAKVVDYEQQIENLKTRIKRTNDDEMGDYYESEVIKVRGDKRDTEKHLSQIQSQLQDAERDARSVRQFKADLELLRSKLASGDVEVRQRLNAHLAGFIDRIEIFARGYPIEYDTDDFADYFYAVQEAGGVIAANAKTEKLQENFIAWVMARRRTKKGRFLRVYLKTPKALTLVAAADEDEKKWGTDDYVFPNSANLYIDILPEGSIAGHPEIMPLWEEFLNYRHKQRIH